MGMFDDITYTMTCPICGHEMRNFQSKDGGCALQKLTPAELARQAAPGIGYGVYFYSDCDKCGTWVDVKFRNRNPDVLFAEKEAEVPGDEFYNWCDEDCPDDCMADHQGEQ